MKVTYYALSMLALAMLLAYLGFQVLAGVAAIAAKTVFVICVMAFLGALVAGVRSRSVPH